MDKKMLELYTDFMLVSSGEVTATTFSKVINGKYSHDQLTRFLSKNEFAEEEHWRYIKPIIKKYESEEEGILAIDDTLLNKPYSNLSDLVCWHYDHTVGGLRKGIQMLNFLYYIKDETKEISLPIAYELIHKPISYSDIKTRRVKRKAVYTKNEIMKDRLSIIVKEQKVKFSYVTADMWFSSVDNMTFIHNELKKKFVMGLKSNRNIALTKEDFINENWCKMSDIDMEGCYTHLIYVKGIDFPLSVIKLVPKNRDDSKSTYSYLVTDDLTLNYSEIHAVYQKRWKVEEFHRSLKQNAKIEKSPTRTLLTQSNYIFLAVYSFVKLEIIKQKEQTNHYALRQQLYIKSIQSVYEQMNKISEELERYKSKYSLSAS